MRTDTLTGKPLFRVKEVAGNHRHSPAKASKGDGKSRFLTPWYFDAQTRNEISGLLEAAGVGDDEGRQLFLTATEFEIGAVRRARSEAPQGSIVSRPEPEPTAEGPIPGELASTAEALAHQLAGLQQAGREAITRILTEADPLGRGYGPAFLEQLRWILERLAQAQVSEAPRPTSPRDPEVPPEIRGLLVQLSRIYRECLEVRLDGADLPLFYQVVAIIARASDLDIPEDPDTIADLLPS